MSRAVLGRREFVGAVAALATSAATSRARAAGNLAAPVLYVSHGAPIFAMNDPARISELRTWGAHLPAPRGIVAMTPHFGSRVQRLGAIGRGFAMYDLPPAIKRRIPRGLDYATPPNDALAARVDALLETHGATSEGRRGFDHTTWMPLACLFPDAAVPVVEISYPYVDDAALFALGRKMAPLRDEGVLFVASGGMTHNLASMEFGAPPAPPPGWSKEFDAWATERLSASDVDSLVDWRTKAPAQNLAHPDDGGHYRVLLVALGVAMGGVGAKPRVEFPIVGFESAMSKRSVQMG